MTLKLHPLQKYQKCCFKCNYNLDLFNTKWNKKEKRKLSKSKYDFQNSSTDY